MISSHILPTTFQKNLSQQNFLKTQQNWDINLGQSVTALPSFFHAQYVQPYSLLPKRRRSPHIHLPHNTYNLILCDPTGVDLLTYAPPPHSSLSPSLQTAAKSGSERRTICHYTPIPLPLTIHTAWFSGTQPASISSHTSYLSSPTSPHYSKSMQHYSLRPNRRRSCHIHHPLTIHTALFLFPNRRRSPHIRLPLTKNTALFSATQPALISSHTPLHHIPQNFSPQNFFETQ